MWVFFFFYESIVNPLLNIFFKNISDGFIVVNSSITSDITRTYSTQIVQFILTSTSTLSLLLTLSVALTLCHPEVDSPGAPTSMPFSISFSSSIAHSLCLTHYRPAVNFLCAPPLTPSLLESDHPASTCYTLLRLHPSSRLVSYIYDSLARFIRLFNLV